MLLLHFNMCRRVAYEDGFDQKSSMLRTVTLQLLCLSVRCPFIISGCTVAKGRCWTH